MEEQRSQIKKQKLMYLSHELKPCFFPLDYVACHTAKLKVVTPLQLLSGGLSGLIFLPQGQEHKKERETVVDKKKGYRL